MPPDKHNFRSSFWSVRKLLIAYHCLSHTPTTLFPLHDIIYPFQYPRSLISNDWEAFRVFVCLTHLKELGITVKKIVVDPLFLSIAEVGAEWLESDKFSAEEIWSLIKRELFTSITEDGGGGFIFNEDYPLTNQDKQALMAPGFFQVELGVSRSKVKRALTQFCQDYRSGNLIHHKAIFSYGFMNSLLKKIVKTLVSHQGKRLHIGTACHQEFFRLFRRKFPLAYAAWQSGEYTLPLYTHLITLDLFDLIELEGFSCSPVHHPINEQDFAYHKIPFRMSINLTLKLPKRKRKVPFVKHTITSIEVQRTNDDQFYLYLNQNYDKPIIMTKNKTSGQLWYSLASDGSVYADDYKASFTYFSNDRRSVFFAKTGYKFTPLLEVKDNFIQPVSTLTVRFASRE